MSVVFIGLVIPILTIAIIVGLVVALATRKAETQDEAKKFNGVIKNLYMHLVMVVALFMMIGGLVYTFQKGVDLLLPEKRVEKEMDPYYLYDQKNQFRNDLKEIATGITFVVIGIPMFIYHNKSSRD